MSVLDRLQEKIELLKTNLDNLKEENNNLKSDMEGASHNQAELQNTIDLLRYELEEKDREIEEIILKVEALLA
ncbi:hypothetical protein MNB_SV-9-886 [hydrothermal vent metagenome]|uniref:Cell division protein ZapB n=1 Tax=hydrothermal vent metagenome TaxID=652676 RepID=A0A1W1BIT4_9ZZZZ